MKNKEFECVNNNACSFYSEDSYVPPGAGGEFADVYDTDKEIFADGDLDGDKICAGENPPCRCFSLYAGAGADADAESSTGGQSQCLSQKVLAKDKCTWSTFESYDALGNVEEGGKSGDCKEFECFGLSDTECAGDDRCKKEEYGSCYRIIDFKDLSDKHIVETGEGKWEAFTEDACTDTTDSGNEHAHPDNRWIITSTICSAVLDDSNAFSGSLPGGSLPGGNSGDPPTGVQECWTVGETCLFKVTGNYGDSDYREATKSENLACKTECDAELKPSGQQRCSGKIESSTCGYDVDYTDPAYDQTKADECYAISGGACPQGCIEYPGMFSCGEFDFCSSVFSTDADGCKKAANCTWFSIGGADDSLGDCITGQSSDLFDDFNSGNTGSNDDFSAAAGDKCYAVTDSRANCEALKTDKDTQLCTTDEYKYISCLTEGTTDPCDDEKLNAALSDGKDPYMNEADCNVIDGCSATTTTTITCAPFSCTHITSADVGAFESMCEARDECRVVKSQGMGGVEGSVQCLDKAIAEYQSSLGLDDDAECTLDIADTNLVCSDFGVGVGAASCCTEENGCKVRNTTFAECLPAEGSQTNWESCEPYNSADLCSSQPGCEYVENSFPTCTEQFSCSTEFEEEACNVVVNGDGETACKWIVSDCLSSCVDKRSAAANPVPRNGTCSLKLEKGVASYVEDSGTDGECGGFGGFGDDYGTGDFGLENSCIDAKADECEYLRDADGYKKCKQVTYDEKVTCRHPDDDCGKEISTIADFRELTEAEEEAQEKADDAAYEKYLSETKCHDAMQNKTECDLHDQCAFDTFACICEDPSQLYVDVNDDVEAGAFSSNSGGTLLDLYQQGDDDQDQCGAIDGSGTWSAVSSYGPATQFQCKAAPSAAKCEWVERGMCYCPVTAEFQVQEGLPEDEIGTLRSRPHIYGRAQCEASASGCEFTSDSPCHPKVFDEMRTCRAATEASVKGDLAECEAYASDANSKCTLLKKTREPTCSAVVVDEDKKCRRNKDGISCRQTDGCDYVPSEMDPELMYQFDSGSNSGFLGPNDENRTLYPGEEGFCKQSFDKIGEGYLPSYCACFQSLSSCHLPKNGEGEQVCEASSFQLEGYCSLDAAFGSSQSDFNCGSVDDKDECNACSGMKWVEPDVNIECMVYDPCKKLDSDACSLNKECSNSCEGQTETGYCMMNSAGDGSTDLPDCSSDDETVCGASQGCEWQTYPCFCSLSFGTSGTSGDGNEFGDGDGDGDLPVMDEYFDCQSMNQTVCGTNVKAMCLPALGSKVTYDQLAVCEKGTSQILCEYYRTEESTCVWREQSSCKWSTPVPDQRCEPKDSTSTNMDTDCYSKTPDECKADTSECSFVTQQDPSYCAMQMKESGLTMDWDTYTDSGGDDFSAPAIAITNEECFADPYMCCNLYTQNDTCTGRLDNYSNPMCVFASLSSNSYCGPIPGDGINCNLTIQEFSTVTADNCGAFDGCQWFEDTSATDQCSYKPPCAHLDETECSDKEGCTYVADAEQTQMSLGYCKIGDQCPNDLSKTEPGTCGCGIPETDTDTDGTPDCVDEEPSNAENSNYKFPDDQSDLNVDLYSTCGFHYENETACTALAPACVWTLYEVSDLTGDDQFAGDVEVKAITPCFTDAVAKFLQLSNSLTDGLADGLADGGSIDGDFAYMQKDASMVCPSIQTKGECNAKKTDKGKRMCSFEAFVVPDYGSDSGSDSFASLSAVCQPYNKCAQDSEEDCTQNQCVWSTSFDRYTEKVTGSCKASEDDYATGNYTCIKSAYQEYDEDSFGFMEDLGLPVIEPDTTEPPPPAKITTVTETSTITTTTIGTSAPTASPTQSPTETSPSASPTSSVTLPTVYVFDCPKGKEALCGDGTFNFMFPFDDIALDARFPLRKLGAMNEVQRNDMENKVKSRFEDRLMSLNAVKYISTVNRVTLYACCDASSQQNEPFYQAGWQGIVARIFVLKNVHVTDVLDTYKDIQSDPMEFTIEGRSRQRRDAGKYSTADVPGMKGGMMVAEVTPGEFAVTTFNDYVDPVTQQEQEDAAKERERLIKEMAAADVGCKAKCQRECKQWGDGECQEYTGLFTQAQLRTHIGKRTCDSCSDLKRANDAHTAECQTKSCGPDGACNDCTAWSAYLETTELNAKKTAAALAKQLKDDADKRAQQQRDAMDEKMKLLQDQEKREKKLEEDIAAEKEKVKNLSEKLQETRDTFDLARAKEQTAIEKENAAAKEMLELRSVNDRDGIRKKAAEQRTLAADTKRLNDDTLLWEAKAIKAEKALNAAKGVQDAKATEYASAQDLVNDAQREVEAAQEAQKEAEDAAKIAANQQSQAAQELQTTKTAIEQGSQVDDSRQEIADLIKKTDSLVQDIEAKDKIVASESFGFSCDTTDSEEACDTKKKENDARVAAETKAQKDKCDDNKCEAANFAAMHVSNKEQEIAERMKELISIQNNRSEELKKFDDHCKTCFPRLSDGALKIEVVNGDKVDTAALDQKLGLKFDFENDCSTLVGPNIVQKCAIQRCTAHWTSGQPATEGNITLVDGNPKGASDCEEAQRSNVSDVSNEVKKKDTEIDETESVIKTESEIKANVATGNKATEEGEEDEDDEEEIKKQKAAAAAKEAADAEDKKKKTTMIIVIVIIVVVLLVCTAGAVIIFRHRYNEMAGGPGMVYSNPVYAAAPGLPGAAGLPGGGGGAGAPGYLGGAQSAEYGRGLIRQQSMC
jgi:hypothetical protein